MTDTEMSARPDEVEAVCATCGKSDMLSVRVFEMHVHPYARVFRTSKGGLVYGLSMVPPGVFQRVLTGRIEFNEEDLDQQDTHIGTHCERCHIKLGDEASFK